MATQEPGRAQQGPALTALPRLEDLPVAERGYDPARVQEAFDAFRRHVSSLQAHLRVLQAAPRAGAAEPLGHAMRMDALNLVRSEAEVARIRQETERQRVEVLNAARTEAREILSKANRDATQEIREAETRGARMLEQARHQATELTNATRAEVEQTLEWARAQAEVIVQRARQGAEQLLSAAGHGEVAIHEAVEAIVRAAASTTEAARPGPKP